MVREYRSRERSMHDLNLTDIKAFHADLLSVATAGVALAGGPLTDQPERGNRGWLAEQRSPAGVDSWRTDLLTIEQRLAAASLEGRPLADALQSEAGVAPYYLRAFQAWLTSDRDPSSLNSWSRTALRARRQLWRLRVAWVQPLIWMGVSYCALMFISLFIAPLFLWFARQARLSPGIALEILLGIRAAVPIWGIVVPLLIAGWAIYLYGRHRRVRLRGFPQSSPSLTLDGDADALCKGVNEDSRVISTGAAGALLGGLLALGIALCVFGPLIELLYSVALPVEVTHVGL